MGENLVILMIFLVCCASLFRPWIGVSSYYLLAILGPQYIWWWHFQNLRVSFFVAIATIVGVCLHFFKQKHYELCFLYNKQNLWVSFLWTSIIVSYFWGPYVSLFDSQRLSPAQLLYFTNIIFFFYFISVIELNSIKKIRLLIIIFVASTIYLIYWANNQYFTQNWSQFHMGRLMGPSSIYGGSIYRDENTFALLFVCGLPFVYYYGWEIKRKWLRWGLWTTIPLGWHAIFLTGSRGGLVALVAALITVIVVSRRKIFVLPLLVLFLVFYQWQAGDVMTDRGQQIVAYEGEGSAEMRLAAWAGGMKMVLDHPLFGVGLGSFITALPHYYDTNPRVAHNTFVQFTAESGVGAGLAYMIVVLIFFKNSKNIRFWCLTSDHDESYKIGLYNDACTASFAALTVCGLFLSLNTYEIFFVLLLINNTLYQVFLKSRSIPIWCSEGTDDEKNSLTI